MKGQGISMNVIIIAAIALLVLVILSVLLLRSGGQIGKGTACEGIANAQCVPEDQPCAEGQIRDVSKPCGEGQVCCLPLG